MQNPINLIDPTGMSPEDSSDGPKPSWFRKFFNSIIFGKKNLNPDGTAISKYSTATGWKRSPSTNNSEKPIASPTRIVQEAITSELVPSEITLNSLIIEGDVLLKGVMTFNDNSSSIAINDKNIPIIGGSNNIDFVFSNIGSIASRSTDGVSVGQNRVTPLSNNQIINLTSIADYLIQNPTSSVNFQFPTPLRASHPNFNRDLTALYGMSFQQITRFLVNQGVTNPNRRVMMSYGTNFGVTLRR